MDVFTGFHQGSDQGKNRSLAQGACCGVTGLMVSLEISNNLFSIINREHFSVKKYWNFNLLVKGNYGLNKGNGCDLEEAVIHGE